MFGHPKGLYVLFFTELWERFSFYGMRAILILYLVSETKNGGLGWSQTDALSLYGWYTMMVYVMSVPGGIIADKYLGQRKSVMIGGGLLCAGHALLAYAEMWAFYTALGLIVFGVGMLKPNISTMVGGLYKDNPEAKDAGFTIFYMGINAGSFAAAIIVGYLGEKIGWHYGFGIAGIGMFIGQIVYIMGQKYLGDSGLFVKKDKTATNNELSLKSWVGYVAVPLIISLIIMFTYSKFVGIFGLIISLFSYLFAIHQSLDKQIEKDRLKVLTISFFIVMVFFAAFEQAGGLMNLYTRSFTDLNLMGMKVPVSWFQSLNPFFIITLAPVMAWIWFKLGRKGKDPSAIFKMGMGTIILGVGFLFMVGACFERGDDTLAKSSMMWIVMAYLFHTVGELALSPVALSFITKMAPAALASSLMGIYFAATGLSNKVASIVGEMADSCGALPVFSAIAVFAITMGSLLVLMTKRINKLAHEDHTENFI